MTKKAIKVIVILGALALLVGAYFGTSAYRQRQLDLSYSPYVPSPRLGNLESSALVKIEVPGLTIEKSGDIWEVTYHEGGIPPGIELDQRQIRGMIFPLSNMWIDSTVDETPEDISIYGLDTPSSRVVLTDSAGNTAEYIRGDLTPTRIHFYAMQKGDPAVYTVSNYHGGLMSFSLDSIRERTIFQIHNIADVTLFRLESPGTLIEIIAKPELVPARLSSIFSTHILTAPYSFPQGVNPDELQKILMPFGDLFIDEFVDDNPSSLIPYGLNRATRILLQTGRESLDLLIGNEVNGAYYAKLTNAPGVFTITGLESVINARPFDLMYKFPLLISIDMVDHFTVTGGERPLSADLEGEGQDAVFFLNGRRAESRSFRNFYQAVIGLIKDAEYLNPTRPAQSAGEILIDLRLNTPGEDSASITLIPYNRDFYILEQDGTMEFLIARSQVRKIFETADAVVFE